MGCDSLQLGLGDSQVPATVHWCLHAGCGPAREQCIAELFSEPFHDILQAELARQAELLAEARTQADNSAREGPAPAVARLHAQLQEQVRSSSNGQLTCCCWLESSREGTAVLHVAMAISLQT